MNPVTPSSYRQDLLTLSILDVHADCRGIIWSYLPLRDLLKLPLLSASFKKAFETIDIQRIAAQMEIPETDRMSLTAIKIALIQTFHIHTFYINNFNLKIRTEALLGRQFCLNAELQCTDALKQFKSFTESCKLPITTIQELERAFVYYPLLREPRPHSPYDDPPTVGVSELDVVNDAELWEELKKVGFDFQKFYESLPWKLQINNVERWKIPFRIIALKKGLNITLEDLRKLPFNLLQLEAGGYTANRYLYSIENLSHLFPSDQKENRLENFSFFIGNERHRTIFISSAKSVCKWLKSGILTLPILSRVSNRYILYDLFQCVDELIALFSEVTQETMRIFRTNRLGINDRFLQALVQNRTIIKTLSPKYGFSLDNVLQIRGAGPWMFLEDLESILTLVEEGYISSQDLFTSRNSFPMHAFLAASKHLVKLTQEWKMEKKPFSTLENTQLHYLFENAHELLGHYTSFRAFKEDYPQLISTSNVSISSNPPKYQKQE